MSPLLPGLVPSKPVSRHTSFGSTRILRRLVSVLATPSWHGHRTVHWRSASCVSPPSLTLSPRGSPTALAWYVCDAAVTNADYVTDRLEHGKNSKHAAACDAVGLRFVPAAFTTLGGWGKAARKMLHTLCAKKKKAEKQAGGNGWDTIRWKQDLLERTCITMAVANFRLLDAHTRAP